jgi:hypothetical protein
MPVSGTGRRLPIFLLLLATTLLARCACTDSAPPVVYPGNCGVSCAQGETCVGGQCLPETCGGAVCNADEACQGGR